MVVQHCNDNIATNSASIEEYEQAVREFTATVEENRTSRMLILSVVNVVWCVVIRVVLPHVRIYIVWRSLAWPDHYFLAQGVIACSISARTKKGVVQFARATCS